MNRDRDKLISVRVNAELYNSVVAHIKKHKWSNLGYNRATSIGDILAKGLKDYLDST